MRLGPVRNQPFALISEVIDGTRTPKARFTCTSCGGKLEITQGGGATINPNFMVKKAAEHGWEARPDHAKARCPRCIENRRKAAKGESPKQEIILSQTTLPKPIIEPVTIEASKDTPMPVVEASKERGVAPAVAKKSPGVAPSIGGGTTGDKEAAPPVLQVIPRLTVDQRIGVRILLDQHFDAEKGFYLAGYDDRKVAEEASVSVGAVSAIREAAYGPIVMPPEMVAAYAELASLEVEMKQAMIKHGEEWDRLRVRVQAALKTVKIDDILAKVRVA